MQTAAAAPAAFPELAELPSNPLHAQSDSSRAHWSDAQWDAWAATTSEEEKFAELKAAVEEGFRSIDEGRGIKIPHGELRNYIRQLGEEASQMLREQRTA